MAGMRVLQDAGTVVHVGVSNYALSRWEEAERQHGGPVVSNQVQFSLTHAGPLDGLVPHAAANGRSVIDWSPLAKASGRPLTRSRAHHALQGQTILLTRLQGSASLNALPEPSSIAVIGGTGERRVSEQPHGPDWWLASDGRYYPPELRNAPASPASAGAAGAAPADRDLGQVPHSTSDRQLRKRVKFLRPPKLHISEEGATINFDLINVGDSSAGVSFKLSFKGETISIDAPSVHLNAGSGPVSVKLDLPTDAGIRTGSKVKVEVQTPGGTTIASSSTGVVSMSVPGAGTLALSKAGLTATAIVGLGAVGTLGWTLAQTGTQSQAIEIPSSLELSSALPKAPDEVESVYPNGVPDAVTVEFIPISDEYAPEGAAEAGVLSQRDFAISVLSSTGGRSEVSATLPTQVAPDSQYGETLAAAGAEFLPSGTATLASCTNGGTPVAQGITTGPVDLESISLSATEAGVLEAVVTASGEFRFQYFEGFSPIGSDCLDEEPATFSWGPN